MPIEVIKKFVLEDAFQGRWDIELHSTVNDREILCIGSEATPGSAMWIDREDAAQLALLLSHYAETGVLNDKVTSPKSGIVASKRLDLCE
jgi:hypothetical protein